LTAPLSAHPAELGDAPAIAEIYNQGIEDRVATFETEPRTPEAIGGLLAARAGRYPAVVVEDDHRVLGFAWTSEYRPRGAYDGVAEVSIYVSRGARGQGVGRLTLATLITDADRRDSGNWFRVSSSRTSAA
jgi:L-amino acid N-acyltransferase YncA